MARSLLDEDNAAPYALRIPDPCDLGVDPREFSPDQLIEHLDERRQDALADFECSQPWKLMMYPDIPLELVEEAMRSITDPVDEQANRDILLELGAVSELRFRQKELAVEDYFGLGGTRRTALRRQLSPTTFATAAAWRMVASMGDTFVLLGASYAYDAFTPILCQKMKEVVQGRVGERCPLAFLNWNAKLVPSWRETVEEPIRLAAEKYPESKASICYGFAYLINVYPLPGWAAAIERAATQVDSGR